MAGAELHRLGFEFPPQGGHRIEASLKIFREQMPPPARASGRDFPGYSDWMNALTCALQHHAITDGADASERAQQEFADYRTGRDVPDRGATVASPLRAGAVIASADVARRDRERLACGSLIKYYSRRIMLEHMMFARIREAIGLRGQPPPGPSVRR